MRYIINTGIVLLVFVTGVIRSIWFRAIRGAEPGDEQAEKGNRFVQLLSALPEEGLLILKGLSTLVFIFIFYLLTGLCIEKLLGIKAPVAFLRKAYLILPVAGLLLGAAGSLMHSVTVTHLGKTIVVLFQTPVPLMLLFFAFYLKRDSAKQ